MLRGVRSLVMDVRLSDAKFRTDQEAEVGVWIMGTSLYRAGAKRLHVSSAYTLYCPGSSPVIV